MVVPLPVRGHSCRQQKPPFFRQGKVSKGPEKILGHAGNQGFPA